MSKKLNLSFSQTSQNRAEMSQREIKKCVDRAKLKLERLRWKEWNTNWVWIRKLTRFHKTETIQLEYFDIQVNSGKGLIRMRPKVIHATIIAHTLIHRSSICELKFKCSLSHNKLCTHELETHTKNIEKL